MRGHAEELLRQHPLVDGHNDLPWAMRMAVRYDLDAIDLAAGTDRTHTDIPRLRKGCVGAQFWSVYVPSSLPGDAAVTATLEQIDFVYELIARFPDVFELALGTADVERAFKAGNVASLMGAEGGHSIACSLGALRMLYHLGVRYMTLTHNDNVAWADAATDEPRSNGLTSFGRAVVGEMNRLGMLVDLSHVAPSTMQHAIETSAAPVVFTHSSCRALVDHPRNVPDTVLASLPSNGGVCMVAFVPDFVSTECREWRLEAQALIAREGVDRSDPAQRDRVSELVASLGPRPTATVADVADHAEHVRDVAGVDHVGVGGDYDGVDKLPTGLDDVSMYPNLFAELFDRGWSDDDCIKLAGANVLRAFGDAEDVSRKLRATSSPSLATIDDLDGTPS